MKKTAVFVVLQAILMLLASCGVKSGPTYLHKAYDEDIPSLKEVFAEDFPVGAAVNTYALTEGSDIYKTVLKHYSLLTCENEMKPEVMNPSEGEFNFDGMDRFMEFCGEHDIAAHGHCLVWHSQVPDWWFKDAGRDTLLDRMHTYIDAVVSRGAGHIAIWDVVNEAVNDDGTLRGIAEGSVYTDIIGDLNGDGKYYDYIEQAFVWAHEADPDALLIYNDYNMEGVTVKTQAVYEMLRDMLERGIPVHGVGLQMHIQSGWPDVNEARKNIRILAKLRDIDPNFSIHITELDMSVFPYGSDARTLELNRAAVQLNAYRWGQLFEIFREEGVDSVTAWGIYDGASWLNGSPVPGRSDYPLLFDRNFTTKPEFWAVVDPDHVKDAVEEYMNYLNPQNGD